VIRFVAEGGMGEVYEANDREIDERVALKVVQPKIAKAAGGLERFRREIQMAHQVHAGCALLTMVPGCT
jgi:serine/threonine protein kinase